MSGRLRPRIDELERYCDIVDKYIVDLEKKLTTRLVVAESKLEDFEGRVRSALRATDEAREGMLRGLAQMEFERARLAALIQLMAEALARELLAAAKPTEKLEQFLAGLVAAARDARRSPDASLPEMSAGFESVIGTLRSQIARQVANAARKGGSET